MNFLFRYLYARKLKKQQALQKKRMAKSYRYLQMGAQFLKWADSQFPNRHARKQFHRDVLKNGAVHSRFVEYFADKIDVYILQSKTKKKKAKTAKKG